MLELFPGLFGNQPPPAVGFGLNWGPHVDGYVLPTQPRLAFAAGTHNKVPVIVGNNKDEATFFMLFMVGGILTGDLPNLIVLAPAATVHQGANINLGSDLGTAAMALYPCNAFDGPLGRRRRTQKPSRMLQYECPARRTARAPRGLGSDAEPVVSLLRSPTPATTSASPQPPRSRP